MRHMTIHRIILLPYSLLVAAPLLAQDPWSRVPAMPTSCYASDDEFDKPVRDTAVALGEDIGAQRAINKALQKQITSDPAAMQTKLVAAMQKNPAQAGEIMGFFEKLGNATTEIAAGPSAEMQAEWEQRFKKLSDDYGSEMDAMLGPIHKRIRDHMHESGGTANDERIVREGWSEYNQKYEAIFCAKRIKTDGVALLAAYKQFILTDYIPKSLEAEANEKKFLVMFDVPTTTYRPVSTLKGVVLYLGKVDAVFGLRRSGPGVP